MKIFNYGKNFINWATELLRKRCSNFEVEKPLLDSDIRIKPQPATDIFQECHIDLEHIKLGRVINQGRDAIVYQTQNDPNMVIRLEFDAVYNPTKLSSKNADINRHIIAASDDEKITLMKFIKGRPMHGSYWHIMQDINYNEFFEELARIKEIPDSAFIKYYNDILELRKKGYNVDTVNPNNILYDEKTKTFNLVDITKSDDVKPEVTIKDFYPFVDNARLEWFYKDSIDGEKEAIRTEVTDFLNRIAKIGRKKGVNLSMPQIDTNHLQKFIVYLYHDCPDLMRTR